MVDKYDTDEDDLNYVPYRDRFVRPNPLRLLQPLPRIPHPHFMMRRLVRQPFIPRFNTFSHSNHHEIFPPRVMMYGPTAAKKQDGKAGSTRVDTTNNFPNRCLNRDFLERNSLEQTQAKNSGDEEEKSTDEPSAKTESDSETKDVKSDQLINDKEPNTDVDTPQTTLDVAEHTNDAESSSSSITDADKSTKNQHPLSETSKVEKSQINKSISSSTTPEDKSKYKNNKPSDSKNNSDRNDRPMTLLENKSMDRQSRPHFSDKHYGGVKNYDSSYERHHHDRKSSTSRNDYQKYGSKDDSPEFERRNASTSFERRNIPPSFERRNAYERQNKDDRDSPYDDIHFERQTKRIPRVGQPFDRLMPARMFDKQNGPRMNNSQSYDKSQETHRDYSPTYDRGNDSPSRSPFEHPHGDPHSQFERHNGPPHDRSEDHQHMFERHNAPSMFERPGDSRFEHPAIMLERPNGPIFEHQSAPNDPAHPMHHLPRPPYMPPRLPHPHYPGMPGITAQAHQTSSTGSVIAPLPFPGAHPMHPHPMPPFRPEFFDPRLRFMPRHPDRPIMPPMFPMPGQFRPPYGHILPPPPHLMHRAPQPIQADPNLNKYEKPLTMATLNDDEVWIQNPTSDNRVYFYNWKTRQTNWEKPEGVRVITQKELNDLLASQSVPKATVRAEAVVPEKPADVAEWTEYKAPDGRAYFHNRRTGTTTWDMPQVLMDWKNGVTNRTVCNNVVTNPAPYVATVMTTTVTPATKVPVEVAKIAEYKFVTKIKEVEKRIPVVIAKVEAKEEVIEENIEEAVEDNSKDRDKSKPVSSTAINGSPWCIVWTGDGRVFYFNPAERTSVWERPEDLKEREDVDKILEDASKELAEMIAQEALSEEPLAKKIKIEETDVSDEQKEEEKMEITEKEVEEAPVKDTTVNKEAEIKAAQDRATLPLEVRMVQFRELMIEKQVSAFSTWEKELHKIVFDARYLLLACQERKKAFEIFVKDRADDERREKKNQIREKKEQFKKLLKEANITSKSSYSDFSSRFAKDDRFQGIEKSRERETVFQDYIDELRKKEKDDKYKEREKVKQGFVALLKEHKVTSHSHWSDVKKKMDSDARYKAVDSSTRREDWFKDYVKKTAKSSGDASKDSAEHTFKAILADVVKSADDSWKDVKRAVRKDSRWDDVEDKIDRSAREDMFKDYVSALKKKSKRK